MQMPGGGGWVYSDDLEAGELFLRLDEQGRVVELYLTKNGAEIVPADLRGLPLSSIKARARSRPDLAAALQGQPSADVYAALRSSFPETWIKDRPQVSPAFELSPASPDCGLSDQFLRDVGAAYRDAVARGLRPNVALAEQTNHGKRTVEKWVYLARKKGYLEPTRPGSVG